MLEHMVLASDTSCDCLVANSNKSELDNLVNILSCKSLDTDSWDFYRSELNNLINKSSFEDGI